MGNQKYRSLKTGVKFKKKEYYCALELALELVGTKWKMMMIYHLRNGGLRSSELQKKDQGCFKQNVHTDCKNIGKRRTGKKESLSRGTS